MTFALLIVRSLAFSTITEVSFAMLKLVIHALLVTRNGAQWWYFLLDFDSARVYKCLQVRRQFQIVVQRLDIAWQHLSFVLGLR